jgi:hypothetical protein
VPAHRWHESRFGRLLGDSTCCLYGRGYSEFLPGRPGTRIQSAISDGRWFWSWIWSVRVGSRPCDITHSRPEGRERGRETAVFAGASSDSQQLSTAGPVEGFTRPCRDPEVNARICGKHERASGSRRRARELKGAPMIAIDQEAVRFQDHRPLHTCGCIGLGGLRR